MTGLDGFLDPLPAVVAFGAVPAGRIFGRQRTYRENVVEVVGDQTGHAGKCFELVRFESLPLFQLLLRRVVGAIDLFEQVLGEVGGRAGKLDFSGRPSSLGADVLEADDARNAILADDGYCEHRGNAARREVRSKEFAGDGVMARVMRHHRASFA